MTDTVLLSLSDNIAILTFNRPAAMNSLNEQMAMELSAITEQISLDPKIRAVLIRGAGNIFMAGGDIRFFHESLDMMPKGVLNLVRMVNGIISNLIHSPKPVVACVHGSVAGVGMSFMLAADLVIAGANTQFTMAYSKLGVSPDGGASYFLPKMVGHKKAMELALLSDVINANQAQDLGLINWVVPEDQLEEKTLQILNKLAKGPTQAYANTKQLIYQSASNSLEQQFEAEARSFAHLSQTADFRSGVTGFLNKTKPEFIGK